MHVQRCFSSSASDSPPQRQPTDQGAAEKTVLYRGKGMVPFRVLVRLKIFQLAGVAALAIPINTFLVQVSASLPPSSLPAPFCHSQQCQVPGTRPGIIVPEGRLGGMLGGMRSMLAAGKCVQCPGGHGHSAGCGMWGSVSDSMVLLQALCWGAVLTASARGRSASCMLQRAGLLGEPRGRTGRLPLLVTCRQAWIHNLLRRQLTGTWRMLCTEVYCMCLLGGPSLIKLPVQQKLRCSVVRYFLCQIKCAG